MEPGREPPFFAGGPIPTARAGAYLHGFEEERRTLVQLLNRRGQDTVGLAAPDEGGKTSLLLGIAPQIPAGRVHVDCGRIWPASPDGFYRTLTQALGKTPKALPKGVALSELAPRLPAPAKDVDLLILENVHRLADLAADGEAAAAEVAERIPLRVVVTGRPEAIAPLAAEPVELGRFREATAQDFLRRRFGSVDCTLAPEAFPVFEEFTRGQPSLLQSLGAATWERLRATGETEVLAHHVETAVGDLVERLPSVRLTTWAQVRGIMRDVFIAMCRYDLESPTGIARRLGAEPKNIVVLLSRLANVHGLVEKTGRSTYQVRDPLLKHHVRKLWASPILR